MNSRIVVAAVEIIMKVRQGSNRHRAAWWCTLAILFCGPLTASCFTGDGLIDQPCQSDADCNPAPDILGQALQCQYNVCGYTPSCGDGLVHEGTEQCDDGNNDNNDGCSANCEHENCGDGVKQEFEGCDDGNIDNNDECMNTCEKARCGDSFVLFGEEDCDDGNKIDNDGCSSTCRTEVCGDGVKQAEEECDDSNKIDGDGCSAECTFETCGNDITEGQEECDDGNNTNSDGCSAHCKIELCGDGFIQDSEKCDDGNRVDGDGCSAECKFEKCGNSVIDKYEECDDGNEISTDDCVFCKYARCGDGALWLGLEECDDQNLEENDACIACKPAFCGDGFVQFGVEECDDGNDDDSDDCAACRVSICNDGLLEPMTEPCEDNNEERNDGCDMCRKGAVSISRGSLAFHTCILRGGVPVCWGENGYGRLGYETTANLGDEPGDLPMDDLHILKDKLTTAIAVGGEHTCAIVDQNIEPGVVQCWGYNSRGQCGAPWWTMNDSIKKQPVKVPVSDNVIVQIAAGGEHTCALDTEGKVYCWGENNSRQLGVAASEPHYTPQLVSLSEAADQIATGRDFTCAHLQDNSVSCWGLNFHKVFFDFWENGPLGPTPVNSLAGAKRVTAGEAHLCGLMDGGSVKCRGGKPGYFSEVCGSYCAGPFTRVVAGGLHTCALEAQSKTVSCWGAGYYGQNGKNSNGPAEVTLPEVVRDLHVGFEHTCALLDGGEVRCWGHNASGQLGIGETDDVFPAMENVCPAGIFDAEPTLMCE